MGKEDTVHRYSHVCVCQVDAIKYTGENAEEVERFLGNDLISPATVAGMKVPLRYRGRYNVTKELEIGRWLTRGTRSLNFEDLSEEEFNELYKDVPHRVFEYAPDMYRLLKRDCPKCITISGGNGDCDQCKVGILLYKIEDADDM